MATEYCLNTTVDQTDPDGNEIPAGSTIHIIMIDDPADYTPDPGLALVPWTGQAVWQPPPPPPVVPQSISAAQGKLALYEAPPVRSGPTLYDDALAAVTAAEGPALIVWNNATVWNRTDQWIGQIATALGLTSAQVDALFVAAAAVQM